MAPDDSARLTLQSGGRVSLAGAWTTGRIAALERALEHQHWPRSTCVRVDAHAVEGMDTAGAWLWLRCKNALEANGCDVHVDGLPDGASRIVEIVADELPALAEGRPQTHTPGWLEGLGAQAAGGAREAFGLLSFAGAVALVCAAAAVRPQRIPWRSVAVQIERVGASALPIVGLLSFLIGVVIAYQGGVQLRNYGAGIFIADLVTLTTVRELGPLITAIVVAGRTGSAFAAQLGTMNVYEEVDALRAMGADPLLVLVAPRCIALLIAMPLLAVFADLLGILGGMVMAIVVLDVGVTDFLARVPSALAERSFVLGIGKAPVFALVIAIVGCFQGLSASGGAAEVGARTTRSVVHGIFLVIVVDAAFSVLYSGLGV